MVDLITVWFKIMQYKDIIVTTNTNLVDNIWPARYLYQYKPRMTKVHNI